MEEKKTDSLGGKKFIPPIRPPAMPGGLGSQRPASPPVPPRPPVPRSLLIERDVPIEIPTGPPPPPKPKPVPVATPVQAQAEDDIVIQTMQDDLGQLGQSSPQPAAETVRAAPVAASAFPLPPKNIKKQQKVVISPAQGRPQKKRWRLWAGIGGGVALFVMISASIWYFLILRSPHTPVETPISDVAALLPASSDLIAAYTLSGDAARSEIQSLWARNGTASLSSLVQGDPRLVLTDQTLTQFFYIILPGDSRPYLLIPETEETKKLLSATSEAAVTTQNGWYVVHQLDTAPYFTTLKNGSLVNTKQSEALKQVASTSPFSLLVRSGPVQSIRSSFGGKNGATGTLQAVALAVKNSSTQKALSFSGAAETSSAVSASKPTSQKLLEAIPQDSTAAYIGGNFNQDIEKWQESSSPFPAEILAQLSVSQVLKTLPVPYVWYTRTGADGVPDTGIVLDLTETTPLPALPDSGIEGALPALVPLLMEQKLTTPVAFKDGLYAETPLRYVNILGSTLALDYAIINNQLAISSSKEGMFTLVDTLLKRSPSALTSLKWQGLFTEWGTIPESDTLLFGTFSQPVLKKLLPKGSGAANDPTLTVAATLQTINNALHINGFVLTSQ